MSNCFDMLNHPRGGAARREVSDFDLLSAVRVNSFVFYLDTLTIAKRARCSLTSCRIDSQRLERPRKFCGSGEIEAQIEIDRDDRFVSCRYSVDDVKPSKQMEYRKSMLRLIESTDGVCDKVLEYNIHKERKDSTRFAKGMSETFSTLHGLVDKGVKVELGIPYELWDKPSAEVTQLKTQCETLLERHEEDIEEWYFHKQEEGPLIDYLCRDRVLAKKDAECLYEVVKPKVKGESGDDEKKSDEKPKKKSSKKKKKQSDDDEEASPKVEL